jgi:chemotaxis protein histidine kinase CheA
MSSQVGLFSAQISEQMQRLRPLVATPAGPGEAQRVDIRRAVMATRLLAGSARILNLEVLHDFLDELLDWLQRIEQTARSMTSTQVLILESIIELEDSLLSHLDRNAEKELELGSFAAQIEDLTGLIHHNCASMDPRETRSSGPRKATPAPAPARDEGSLVSLRARVQSARTTEERDELLAQIESQIEELSSLANLLHVESAQPTAETWDYPVEGLDPHPDPAGDPVMGPAIARLQNAATEIGCHLEIQAYGSASTLVNPLRGPVSEILSALVQDIASAAAAEPELAALKAVFELREDQGRVRILLADNGPRSGGAGAIADADDLSMLSGLRRARTLLEQIGGLIRVEPRENPAVRFETVVPLDPARPGYIVLALESGQVAVPAALYERTVRAGGLLYETDEGGESVQLHGRSVPLAELGEYVSEVIPSSGSSPFLVIAGSVEKRLGLACEKPPVIVRTSSLGDPPHGWEHVAYGSILLEGEMIPVLDIRRLLDVRFRALTDTAQPGSISELSVDAWEPAQDPVSQRVAPLSGMIAPVSFPTVMRTLLVNQSEFRRRELLRNLESLGMEVEVCADLQKARKRLGAGNVDLLVTDLRLGQEHGVSFPELHQQFPGLQIVLTSSVAREYAGDLAERTGADRCWLDPYRASDLGVMLEALRQV